MTEAAWMELIDGWAAETGVRVEYYSLEESWPSNFPEPDLVIGPGLYPWKNRYQNLLPLFDSNADEVISAFIQGPPVGSQNWTLMTLTLVPAVVVVQQSSRSAATLEWMDLLELSPRSRRGFKFSPWWVPELAPAILASDPSQLEVWRTMDREFPSRLSGLIPFIEIRNGQIPAWVMPVYRLRQLENQGLSIFSWSYLMKDKRHVLYPLGSQLALTKNARSEAKDFLNWIIKKSSIKSLLEQAPSQRLKHQWSNFVRDVYPQTASQEEFLSPLFCPPDEVNRLAEGEIDWEIFRQKCVLTY